MAEDEAEIAILGRRIAYECGGVAGSRETLAASRLSRRGASRTRGKRNSLRSELEAALRDVTAERDRSPGPCSAGTTGSAGSDPGALPATGGCAEDCDTSVPLQRRNMMAWTGQIEVCEACEFCSTRRGLNTVAPARWILPTHPRRWPCARWRPR